MEQEPKVKNVLEKLQETIGDSAPAIEAEFGRTPNDWLSCFGTRVFAIQIYLDMSGEKGLISPEKYQDARLKLLKLLEQLHELRSQYPDKETIPPANIKQELLDNLNVLG